MTDLPYQAEYSKSGRASCKGCKQLIEKGVLRLAVMVQSAFFDGKQPNWHHEECFFKKQRPQNVNDIANFNILKLEDQKKIKERIENSSGVVMPVEKGKGKSKASKRANADSNNGALKDFLVEYSKSSRATCRHCEIKICKDEIRICKTVYDTEVGKKYGGQPLWHHVKCFVEERFNLLYMAGGENLPGYNTLSKEDQQMLKNEIKPLKVDEVPVKKLKEEPKDEQELKEEKELEKKLEKQNKLFHKHKDALSKLNKNELHELLQANSQEVPPGIDECLDRLADCMAFGALDPCPECNGQLVLDNFGYKCTGNISEWTKCRYVAREPKRKAMNVPKAFKKNAPFNKYKPKADVRVFPPAPPPSTIIVKKEEPVDKKEIRIPPLKNLQFFLYGKLPAKEKLKNRILKLGGLVVGKLTDTLAAVVSTEAEVTKMPSKMEEIQEKDIEVVEESFFDLIDPEVGTVADTLRLIKEKNIAEWGSDPVTRLPQDVIDGKSIPKSGSMYVKSSKSGVTKFKVKDGAAVDPDSGLEDVAHVYTEGKTKYMAVLGKTDITSGKNSFYKLQLLESDGKKKYWVFRSWGRIGTTIGGKKVQNFNNLYSAKKSFEEFYKEKTQNSWESRDQFKKFPDCYYPVDIEFGADEPPQDMQNLQTNTESKLPLPVQELIVKIFDVNLMTKTLLEFEIDTEKMPLGKLSKKQIKSGYEVLTELLQYLEKQQASENKIIDATNRFYTLIPHDFGVNNPPPLDNIELIKKKTEMLDNLLEIEIAYGLLKIDTSQAISPVDAHYIQLKTDIAPLERSAPDFQMILEYMTNTHAPTHSNYALEIEQVFKVVREGENKRYKPFKKLHNRRLLWHGSRVTNFAGILSQGLRIAPPEAPVTGYMFGKGIYFADMVSKSANYCCTSHSEPVGILLLCEVALGDMQEFDRSHYVTKLPSGKHSTWGVGRTQPDPTQARVLDDGTIVPMGKPITAHHNTVLLYNEFIVYDVAQVNVKYLLQVKFKFM